MSIDLIHGDCRATLPPGPFDVCMTDPPYGDTALAWDSIVPGWVGAVASVLKPVASMWVFGSMRFLAPLFAELQVHGFRYSQDIVWEKQNGTGFHTDRFRRVHEHAVLFYRGAWSEVYHETQRDGTFNTHGTLRRKAGPVHFGANEANFTVEGGRERLMRSVIRANNEHRKAIHPTQKPVELLRPLVRYSVPPGGSVVDPFAGSGSTLLAAHAEGRDAVGVELSHDYYLGASARINQALYGDLA